MTYEELCKAAIKAMENSYSPYSGVAVGAALLSESGKVFTGCNIENASFSPTVCAERTAIFKAVSEGERSFTAIAVAGGKNGELIAEFPPCGVCRQVMCEFCSPEFTILTVTGNTTFKEYKLKELMPLSFGGETVKK